MINSLLSSTNKSLRRAGWGAERTDRIGTGSETMQVRKLDHIFQLFHSLAYLPKWGPMSSLLGDFTMTPQVKTVLGTPH